MEHAYFGPGFDSRACAAALRAAGLSSEALADDELLPRVARLLADGAVVGWFQGRLEFGPRALGNRSFLADPRSADARDLLVEKVKLREWFRPLAPSILAEASGDVFGRPHEDPFMITVARVAEEQRARIPGVVHVDGTARPQTVRRETNPRYWRLIKEFQQLTGVPVLLNTSFNLSGEPIVCTPADAVETFRKTKLDALVLEDHLVLR
jgi:carbamoyltransferase